MTNERLTAVYPGTFDPITNGHIDIIDRARRHFSLVVVAVSQNPGKAPLFTQEERIAMAKEAVGNLDGIEVDTFDGLLVDYLGRRGASVLVKGLRAIGDFDYELQMAQMNYKMAGVETFFMVANPIYSFLSSSIVKEIARFGRETDGLVPPEVARRLKERYRAE